MVTAGNYTPYIYRHPEKVVSECQQQNDVNLDDLETGWTANNLDEESKEGGGSEKTYG